ncbi:MAG: hypothetical protein ACUVSU_11735 [Aggregatilineaceae bacterium]
MGSHRLIRFLSSVLVISIGLTTLIGLSTAEGTSPANFAAFMLRLTSVTAAVAVFVGVINLLAVHWGRMRRSERGWPYSLLTVIAALAVLVLRVLDRADMWSGDLEGEQMSERIFEAVQVSLESALAGLVLFFLVYAAYRLMRRRVTGWSLVFTGALLLALVGWIPLDGTEVLADAREWLIRVPVSAGARGILIGVGLGTVAAGVRALTGQDRSIRG